MPPENQDPAAPKTDPKTPPPAEGDINIIVSDKTKVDTEPIAAIDKERAKDALRIDALEKENEKIKVEGIIEKLKAKDVNTKDFEKRYNFDTLKGMLELKEAEAKAANVMPKDGAGGVKLDVSLDPGWLDHLPVPGYPHGVWRSSTDDSIIKDSRNRDLSQEQRAK